MEDFDHRSADTKDLPAPVHESVVRSLYGEQKTLMVGVATLVLAPIVLFYRTGDQAQLIIAMALFGVGLMRVVDSRFFWKAAKGNFDKKELRFWENRYASLGAAYVGLLGAWCLVGFARTSDEFVHLTSISVTISYMVGIIGRNFSSEKVVLSQTVFAGLPLLLGVALFTDIFHLTLGLFLLPLFLSIWFMSRNLRSMLFAAVLNAIDSRTIADRFDIALNNVSHGMAMFDKDMRVVVVNSRFASLCGLPEGTSLQSKTVGEIPNSSALVDTSNGKVQLRDMLVACLIRGKRASFSFVIDGGVVVEAKFNPMANDGGVLVLEDILERVNSENEIRKLASFDPLTHLPNRRFFMNEVNRVLGGIDGLSPCTFLFVDLDNFKDINDTLGHSVGDKLLCSVALRMRSHMPEKAMVCRFGGDEFVIVIPGKLRRKDCSELAEKLGREISKSVCVDSHQLNVGASIGIAQSPVNGREFNQLLKAADMALYDAKARGRSRHSYYSDELGDLIRDRRKMENELRRAIDLGQLEIHYQPLVSLDVNRVTTCEALLRWNHPERGMVSPAVFIPVAEEIGIITKIGKFVLDEATKQCCEWPNDISVAVNVSSLQFQQSDVCAVVKSALANSGLDPSRLEIEVTESAMLENVSETTATLNRLSAIGVNISLDDFGTGFSSLSYLHALPLNKVKIDRSFIENVLEDDRSIVLLSGVTHLAHELGLKITIEGVETTEQLDLLSRKVKVDQVQGYLFGRAMPPADIAELLAVRNFGAERLKLAASY
ncbi:MAG: EAL domain-containing protein [Rhizobiaceae bacterium]